MVNTSDIKSAILSKMKSNSILPTGCNKIFDQLYELLLNTIDNGEGNSVLLVGPRGIGKSSLMNYTMKKIESTCKHKYILIYLNGYVCVDDQQALKEIAKHLCPDKELPDLNINSFSSTMTFLLETLNSGDSKRQSIIFLMDEFDLFTQHHNQHLLYNLFDISQSKSTPIAVVGLTCRQDIMELMEKRVKSRFSHRQFFMYGPSNFAEYNDIIIDILCPESVTCKQWKQHVVNTLKDKSNNLQAHLECLYNYTRSIRVLQNYLTWVVINMSSAKPKLNVKLLEEKLVEAFRDAKAVLIKSLSKLECCMLISMARLSAKHANQPFNLEMVLHEYQEFVTFEGRKIDEIPNHSLAVKAIERMIDAQLVRTLSNRQSKVQKDYRQMYLNIDIMDLLNIIKNCILPSNIQKWAQSVLTF